MITVEASTAAYIDEIIEGILFKYERENKEFNLLFREIFHKINNNCRIDITGMLFKLEEIHNKDKAALIAETIQRMDEVRSCLNTASS